MPDFISKLQHNTYEKGEFTDEQSRSLADTLEIIKTFPWDKERTLTDIQLTGPSVTIQDDMGNYLKIGLYFGGKYCLYYLDTDNHLYEYHLPELKDVYTVVTDFFSGQIDLGKFEKHFLSMGSKSHFQNASFEHTINTFAFAMRFVSSIFLLLLMIGSVSTLIISKPPAVVGIIFPIFLLAICMLVIYTLYLTLRFYNRSKNMYLNLSQGNPIFQFGDNDEVREYNKGDISNINVYGPYSTKGTPILNIMEIVFKDGSGIKLPGMLIDPLVFISKFKDIKTEFFSKQAEVQKSRWAFARGE
ncbi:hypothetical protein [Mucilaginibacter sp.]|uniref:hypothetical protein n=1 Tax=Mucilaginibacter sp. TaxID=1882438 RepID=UPI003D0B6675